MRLCLVGNFICVFLLADRLPASYSFQSATGDGSGRLRAAVRYQIVGGPQWPVRPCGPGPDLACGACGPLWRRFSGSRGPSWGVVWETAPFFLSSLAPTIGGVGPNGCSSNLFC
ncbi:hypothetical protein NDU88_001847 [Pleurodeles waltl]|uniref:Secreted protein n=1 Tax=Pleurodeles waltl TaxID=8319 RepID=A0AAV7NFF9_PLEWA|nr:hypothetical protein NDU88_001847 [Pleurodeles waltl]